MGFMNLPHIAQIFTDDLICGNLCNLWLLIDHGYGQVRS